MRGTRLIGVKSRLQSRDHAAFALARHGTGVVHHPQRVRRLAQARLIGVKRLFDDLGGWHGDGLQHRGVRIDAPFLAERVLHLRVLGIRQGAAQTGPAARAFEQFLGILRRDRLAEPLERLFLVLPAIHVGERGIGDRNAVGWIDRQQWLRILRRQFLIGLNDQRFVIHHGIAGIRIVDQHVLEPVG